MNIIDLNLIEAIAAELAVDPSFVEKEWYAILLLALIKNFPNSTVTPVFSGGTSLSKGYGLIQRFSEDLDFKMLLPEGGITRRECREYRHQLVDLIRQAGSWTLEDNNIESKNQSRFFSCLIGYDSAFIQNPSLRSHLKLEVTFESPKLPVEERSLQSFVAKARREPPEVAMLACISPVETAADKLSALTWRVLTRQRGGEGDDPTLVRHLYDLVALESYVAQSADFPSLARSLLQQDAKRGQPSPEIQAMTVVERLSQALALLTSDTDYQREYEQFVLAMSYAKEDETPSYTQALEIVRRFQALL